jgi:hypothetical protein
LTTFSRAEILNLHCFWQARLGCLLVFFQMIGLGGLGGMNFSPKPIPASFMPHLLSGVLLWALDKYVRRNHTSID